MSDVCLVLEGTWPVRTGGVASWLHDLVTALPQLSFTVAHLHTGSAPRDQVYPVPGPGPTACASAWSAGSCRSRMWTLRLELGRNGRARWRDGRRHAALTGGYQRLYTRLLEGKR
jgi:hypothetical protein